MAERQTKYSPEEMARRGDEIYEKRVRSEVEAKHHGKVAAIDVETGDYAVGDTAREAANRLRAQRPDAEIWSVRIGHRALYRIGAHPLTGKT